MKLIKNIPVVFACLLLITSCQNTWDNEAKNLYLQACEEEAQSWNTDAASRKNYCNCALQKTMNRYPKYTDALANTLEDTVLIKQIQACRVAN